MGSFWKVLAMGVTAAAAVVIAKEVIERTERGEDRSPMAVLKGIGRKIGDFCSSAGVVADDDFDDFGDFEDFEISDEDNGEEGVDFDTADMESDKLTDEGYIMEFDADKDGAPASDEDDEAEAAPAPEADEKEGNGDASFENDIPADE